MTLRRDGGDASHLDVATWNVHGGRGIDDRYGLSKVIDLIERRDPDVIGLQEVDRNFRSASDFDDQLDVLADELDMQARFGPTLVRDPTDTADGARGEYGIAVLCTHEYPIEGTEHHLLPSEGNSSEQRGLLETEIAVEDGTLFLYNTHLTTVDALRPQQVSSLLSITGRRSDPQVLVGDFNATPDSRSIELVTGRYDDAAARSGREEHATRPPGCPSHRIDYVFVTPGVNVLDYTVVDAIASDHLLVESTLSVS